MPDKSIPPVSVMIATRNRLALLQRALRSVFAQDYSKLEILIVDDASEDGTSDYIRSHYPDIRLFRFEENRGLVTARNLMMREAQGEYIFSIDDDAYFLNQDAISKVVDRMQPEPELGVVTFRILKREDEDLCGAEGEHYTNLFLGGAHCIRKAVLAEVGYYRESFFRQAEESDLALRLLDKGYRLCFFSGATIVHEFSPVARDFASLAINGAKNLLLRAWINEPFPWWVLSTANSVVKLVYHGARKRTLPYVLAGFWAAIRELPRVKSMRRPVSSKTMRLYFALRQKMVTDVSDVRRLYGAPPSFLRSFLGM